MLRKREILFAVSCHLCHFRRKSALLGGAGGAIERQSGAHARYGVGMCRRPRLNQLAHQQLGERTALAARFRHQQALERGDALDGAHAETADTLGHAAFEAI